MQYPQKYFKYLRLQWLLLDIEAADISHKTRDNLGTLDESRSAGGAIGGAGA
jgi:hypothetical protein